VSHLYVLSGGAAQGLVASLAPTFKALTAFDIISEFGAVGAMVEKLRRGAAADMVIFTAAMVAQLATEKLVASSSIADLGSVETALAVRAGERPVTASDAAALREILLAADAIFVPDTRTSTAGIHVAKVLNRLGIAEQVAARLRIFANGATAMRQLATSDAKRPVGCTQSTEILATPGVVLSGSLPSGCELATMYTAAIAVGAAHPREAADLIGLLTAADQQGSRQQAGFLDARA
jgi:molybdate transport system substrate-binding protein